MNIKKPLLIAGVVTSIGAAGLGGSALVSADTSASGSNSLVSKIAQKFNLKTADVQAVFDEERTAKEAERQAEVEKTLTQAVTDGKLTQAQKDKIIAKQKELQAAREAERAAMEGKTDAEREAAREAKKAEMDTKRTELTKWATDNSIPTEYLKYVMGHGGKGPGGPGGR
jgi:hypothetical protein